jgi:hypothetical protein
MIFPSAQSALDKALRFKYIPEYSAAAALALQMLFDSRETGETAGDNVKDLSAP